MQKEAPPIAFSYFPAVKNGGRYIVHPKKYRYFPSDVSIKLNNDFLEK